MTAPTADGSAPASTPVADNAPEPVALRVLAMEAIAIALAATAAHALVLRNARLALRADDYSQPFIVAQALGTSRFVLPFAVIVAPLLVRRRAFSWSGLDGGLTTRIVVCASTLVLAWSFSTYDTNAYFGQAHVADRILLVLLAIGAFYVPVLVLPFAALATLLASQFGYPLGGYTWIDKIPLLHVLVVFTAFLVCRSVLNLSLRLFPIFATAVLAGPYLVSGIAKIGAGWLTGNDFGNLFVSSHLNGWLPDLSTPTVASIARLLGDLSPVLSVMTLMVEVAAVAILLRRPVGVVILSALILLHVVIFVSTGIFFWKWLILDTALTTAFLMEPRHFVWRVTSRQRALVFGVALGQVLVVQDPTPLVWRDTNLAEVYELEAVAADGRRAPVGRGAMEPYDVIFAQNRFQFLDREPSLVGTYGSTTDRELADLLDGAGSRAEIEALRSRFGKDRFDPQRAEDFDRFLRRTVPAALDEVDRGLLAVPFRAPHHIWNGLPECSLGFSSAAVADRVEVRRRRFLVRDGRPMLLDDEVIRTVRLAAP